MSTIEIISKRYVNPLATIDNNIAIIKKNASPLFDKMTVLVDDCFQLDIAQFLLFWEDI